MPSCGPFQIRQAGLTDLDRIAEMEAAIWREMAADRGMLAKRFRSFPSGFLVAQVGPNLAGFCMALRVHAGELEGGRVLELSLENHASNGSVLFLLGLTVDPVFRGNGIGSALAQAELDLAWRLGCTAVELVANTYSRGLFERLNFTVLRELDPVSFQAFPELMPHPLHMIRKLSQNPEPPGSA